MLRDGIPLVVRKLKVSGGGSIFVFSRNASYVHAYIIPYIINKYKKTSTKRVPM
jgi:hypothetical protein